MVDETELPTLTHQQLVFAECRFHGLTIPISSKRAGISVGCGEKWSVSPEIKAHIAQLSAEKAEILAKEVRYSLEDAHMDIEQGKKMSANAMEWFRGVEMQMKLHGLGQDKKDPLVSVNINNINKTDQLEVMDDAQLLELAGDSFERLQPGTEEG
ncbi:hypothetical protein DV711_06180 [Motiliproteus coralliicola]|uniref:Uncharacterized protein n=1 Tax=Motiliproteus coralliicola TaxID=2283196 RepID=A0A369WSS0_9GAMM|nr:hypothetical protein [Motiliproteus coralliicola]RDE25140.1 hypothetical protein DV711_06180 [Motiliproteus coralliicola]